jgi:hypothetical protein
LAYHDITEFVFKDILFHLVIVPKYKNIDAENSDMKKKSHEILPLSEKVKVFYLIKEKTK